MSSTCSNGRLTLRTNFLTKQLLCEWESNSSTDKRDSALEVCIAPCTTNRTPSREAISDDVAPVGTFKIVDVGRTSTPSRFARRETKASAKPKQSPLSSLNSPRRRSGSTASDERSARQITSSGAGVLALALALSGKSESG